MTISDEPQVRTFRWQLRVFCGCVAAVGVAIGSPGAVSAALAGDGERAVVMAA